MSNEEQLPKSEWSYFIEAENITDEKQKIEIAADENERSNLAVRLGIVSIEKAVANVVVSRAKGSMVVHVRGDLSADVTQECVVTSDPVQGHIEESFEAWFADTESAISFSKARKEKAMKKGQAELQIADESEDPEPITDGKIDLGDLASQYLSLSLNAYPHATGVENHHGGDDDSKGKGPVMDNPFAGLKEWKAKLTGDEG